MDQEIMEMVVPLRFYTLEELEAMNTGISTDDSPNSAAEEKVIFFDGKDIRELSREELLVSIEVLYSDMNYWKRQTEEAREWAINFSRAIR